MTKKIKLNHLSANNSAVYRHIALVLSASIMLAVFFAHISIHNQLKKQEAELLSLQHPAADTSALKISTQFNTKKRDEIASVQKAKNKLNLPWETLFETLETQQRADVQLLEISPNPEQTKLSITAQANDVNAMLAYVQALNTQPILSKVFLKTQTPISNEGGGDVKSVRFEVEAKWLM